MCVCVGGEVGGLGLPSMFIWGFPAGQVFSLGRGGGAAGGGWRGASQRAEGSGLGGWPPVSMISPDSSLFFLQKGGVVRRCGRV